MELKLSTPDVRLLANGVPSLTFLSLLIPLFSLSLSAFLPHHTRVCGKHLLDSFEDGTDLVSPVLLSDLEEEAISKQISVPQDSSSDE